MKNTRIPATWYLDDDVLTAARKRIRRILDLFDHVVVAFSGGKDSMVVLHLMHEFQERVKVMFLDEELIPETVLGVVDYYRQLDWVDMRWVAVPLSNTKYILGKTYPYVQWDESGEREWLRPKPAHSLTSLVLPPKDGTSYDQSEMPACVPGMFGLNGKVCVLTGVRATEGNRRFLSIATKLNECYIVAAEGSKQVQQGKPIYDMTEEDVFKYLYECGANVSKIYDAQAAIGSNLRVSSPLHVEKMLYAPEQNQHDPEFWDRVTKIFPEVRIQERYGADLDREGAAKGYGNTWQDIRRWIDENITDPELYPKAVKCYDRVKRRAVMAPDRYPLHLILDHFVTGLFAKRDILPRATKAFRAKAIS